MIKLKNIKKAQIMCLLGVLFYRDVSKKLVKSKLFQSILDVCA